MKRVIAIIFLALVWNSMLLAQTPDEILVAVDKIRAPGENFGFDLRVIQEQDGQTKLEFGFRVQVKDSVKSLVSYESPSSSKGKRLLMVEQNMWIYVPGTRRSIRISPQQQLLGQVSNADVARVVYNIDYHAESMINSTFTGQDVLILRLIPRNSTNPYEHIELVVAREDSRPLQAKFFALSGRLLKTISYHDYQMVLGVQRPMQMLVKDAINTSKIIVMYYSNLRIMDTPYLYFQKDYLPRLQ